MAKSPSARSLRSLDWVNFYIADVQMAAGAFVAIYLAVSRHLNPAQVGSVVAAQNVATLLVQVPAGAWIDRSPRKQWIVATAAGVVGACSLGVLATSTVAAAETAII